MKQYRYRVTLEQLTDANGVPGDGEPLKFEVGSHDDIMSIVARVSSRGDFSSQAEAAAFGVGLKLFGGAILANKDDPLLSSFLPQLYQFVKEFKAGSGDSKEKV